MTGQDLKSSLTDFDPHLLRQGSHLKLCQKFGAHRPSPDSVLGAYFAVWGTLVITLPPLAPVVWKARG